ncbi:MAG: hypothetical protein Q8O30_07265 [Candidatus Omnitrophota bacterium]|nr:hypothetical protein [Candidatus Omnitrophota bacterium]
MRNISIFSVALIFTSCIIFPAFSQTESITITTYYPAPFGVYRQLVTQTLGVGDNNTDGVIGGNDAPDPATDPGEVWISGNVGIGTTNPQGELHIRSTDNTNGNANLIIEGENPANGASTGSWDINSQGGTPGTPPAGNLQFNSTDTATPVNTTTPMTIEQGAPNDSLYVADNGNVGMGTNDPRAKLDVASTTNGFLPPRMTTAQRDAITGVEGMTIYNTDAKKLQVYTPSGWQNVGGGLGPPDYDSGWQNWATKGPGNKAESRLTHDLRTTNVLIYLESRDIDNWPPVQQVQGIWQVGTNYSDYGGSTYDTHTVLFWQQLTPTQILVSGILDPYPAPGHTNTQIIDQFRLRIWKIN